jgi:hypothetical protein
MVISGGRRLTLLWQGDPNEREGFAGQNTIESRFARRGWRYSLVGRKSRRAQRQPFCQRQLRAGFEPRTWGNHPPIILATQSVNSNPSERNRAHAAAQIRRDTIKDASETIAAPRSSPYRTDERELIPTGAPSHQSLLTTHYQVYFWFFNLFPVGPGCA